MDVNRAGQPAGGTRLSVCAPSCSTTSMFAHSATKSNALHSTAALLEARTGRVGRGLVGWPAFRSVAHHECGRPVVGPGGIVIGAHSVTYGGDGVYAWLKRN
jgi:hypothetical protein